MKFFEIGVYHHDCWFTDAISHFPELQVREISGRTYASPGSDKRVVKALYKVDSTELEMFNRFANYVSRSGRVLETKSIDNRFLQVAWKSPLTSYDAVLNSGCTISSSCYAKDGLETYSAFAEQSNTIKKLLSELESIGEVKIFSIRNCASSKKNKFGKFGLTLKQRQAISSAISMGYYEWPKKVNLEEMAAKLGIKRRALQENLRKAERKVLPKIIEDISED